MIKKAKNMPCTRHGWYEYYAKKYKKTPTDECAHLACWYLTLHLAFGE